MVTKEKKYDFYASKRSNGVTLHSIRALRDIPCANVKKGDLGGWIESESNLDQCDDSWVYKDAMVYGNARVVNNSYVYGYAKVYDNAVINSSSVHGAAVVSGNAVINNSEVYGDAEVKDDAVVTGSIIKDHVEIYRDAVVTNCDIDDTIHIDSNTDTTEFKRLNLNIAPTVYQPYILNEDEEDLVKYILKSTFFKGDGKFDAKTYHVTTKYQHDAEFDMYMSRLYASGDRDTNALTEIYMLELLVTYNNYNLEEAGLPRCSTRISRSITISIEHTTDFNTYKSLYKMNVPSLDADEASDDEYMDNFRKVLEAYASVFEYKGNKKVDRGIER